MDVDRRVGDRVPIVVPDRGGFEFREAAVAVNLEGRPRGIIGWDPVLGWVFIVEPPPRDPYR